MQRQFLIALVLGLTFGWGLGCGEKNENRPQEPVAEHPTPKETEKPIKAQDVQATSAQREPLDLVIPRLLPDDTHALGVFPSLATTEETLKLGALVGKEFSSERRGLRPLEALDTIGASLETPDSWSRLGISPRTGLLAAIVDSNTLVIALETTGIEDFLPKWKMVLTVLTGKAPVVEKHKDGFHKITVGSPRAWALAAEQWVMLVLTSGAEEPTENALSLGPPATSPLANDPGFKKSYPAPKGQRILNGYVSIEQLLKEELAELRAEKHGSWLYAEKLLATAIRDQKPQRVIAHWEKKVANEKAWSKENRAGLLAAADVLESTYGGINQVGFYSSLTPYGIEAEVAVSMVEQAKLKGLFPASHPTTIAHVGSLKDTPPLWMAGSINFGAMEGMLSHLPSAIEGIPLKPLFTQLTDNPLQLSAAYAPGKDGSISSLAMRVNGLKKEAISGVLPLLERSVKESKAGIVIEKNGDSGIQLTRQVDVPERTIEKEGKARLVADVHLRALGPLLRDKTKTTEPTTEDPVEQSIVGEMNQIRIQRDEDLAKERNRFLESLGTLSIRVLPKETGWSIRADVVAQTGLDGASKAWVTWMSQQTQIEKETSKALADKRRELRGNRGGRRAIPILP